MPVQESEPLEQVLRRLENKYDNDEDDTSLNATKYVEEHRDFNHTPVINIANNSMLPLLAAICIIPRNEPNDYVRLFRYFAQDSKYAQSIDLPNLVLRLRTALFKAVPLVGVPRVINAQSALYDAVKSHPNAEYILARLPTESTKPTKTTEEDAAAGWTFFKAIYAKHAQNIIDRIGRTSPDLAEMILAELYGANLSRTEVLSWKETVLIEFVGWCVHEHAQVLSKVADYACSASLNCPAQTKGHFFGCRNLGVGKKNVLLAIEVLREMGRWRGEPLVEAAVPFISTVGQWPL